MFVVIVAGKIFVDKIFVLRGSESNLISQGRKGDMDFIEVFFRLNLIIKSPLNKMKY